METDPQIRKQQPMARGVLDYFPDAIAAIANVSYVGNEQHNPGEEMHWARGKSSDHADCIIRHLVDRGTDDADGLAHSAKVAWRALALLQEEIETSRVVDTQTEFLRTIADGEIVAVNDIHRPFYPNPQQAADKVGGKLDKLDCPMSVRRLITRSLDFPEGGMSGDVAYISGPMRGLPQLNFPAFDAEKARLLGMGHGVISPADLDRAAGDTPETYESQTQQQRQAAAAGFVVRDTFALLCCDSVRLIEGWQNSTGAAAEIKMAKWAGIPVYDEHGEIL